MKLMADNIKRVSVMNLLVHVALRLHSTLAELITVGLIENLHRKI